MVRTASIVALASVASVVPVSESRAGCGCDKPPPLPAQVRPQVTYPGARVVLFSDAFRQGQSYRVTFRSMSGTSATVGGTVVTRRDIADRVYKPQHVVKGGATRTIFGPGSFQASKVDVSNGATLFIENSAGPVTLYVTGDVGVSGGGKIAVADPDPEMFALYVSGPGPVALSDSGSFYGVVYAPTSPITLSGGGRFTGAFVGELLSVSNGAAVRYDETLGGW